MKFLFLRYRDPFKYHVYRDKDGNEYEVKPCCSNCKAGPAAACEKNRNEARANFACDGWEWRRA